MRKAFVRHIKKPSIYIHFRCPDMNRMLFSASDLVIRRVAQKRHCWQNRLSKQGLCISSGLPIKFHLGMFTHITHHLTSKPSTKMVCQLQLCEGFKTSDSLSSFPLQFVDFDPDWFQNLRSQLGIYMVYGWYLLVASFVKFGPYGPYGPYVITLRIWISNAVHSDHWHMAQRHDVDSLRRGLAIWL